MTPKMFLHNFLVLLIVLGTITAVHAKDQQPIPDKVDTVLEYVLSLSQPEIEFAPEKLSALISFVQSTPSGFSVTLPERKGAVGAFHAFTIHGDLTNVIDYAYNPDIPSYVTMPSSVRHQEWLTPLVNEELRNLPHKVESTSDIRLLRGRDREIITPDTNTGGYYAYTQERFVAILPGSTGPVLISTSSQVDSSEVGKKGCVVGDDGNWNYLYSNETGLSTTGLGWVDSYMYHADSVIIYISDSSASKIHVGLFKWLNAGWAKINMVKAHHIQNGIKRFAADFKAVLESPGLPDAPVIAGRYRELLQTSEEELRRLVLPYLQALSVSDDLNVCPNFLENMVSSGEYLQQMSHGELVRVLLLEYIKKYIGKEPLVRIASRPIQTSRSISGP